MSLEAESKLDLDLPLGLALCSHFITVSSNFMLYCTGYLGAPLPDRIICGTGITMHLITR
jgi:hypothetical protein